MAVVNKRIFDTDNALKGSFNGLIGKWQLITYSSLVLAYAIIVGWIHNLHEFTLLVPSEVGCNYTKTENSTYKNNSIIQRLAGKGKYIIDNGLVEFKLNYSLEYGETVPTEYDILCDLESYTKVPRFSHYFGFIMGSSLLGFTSDRGGRKMIILACIWSTGIMSIFQLVGHDFISYVFFEFFIGLFIGGVQASFLPTVIEMFPISFRTFYGVFFHINVCLFQLILPWLANSLKSWKLLQIFVTSPILLTAALNWIAFESIFWYLAHKEYDKAIQVLTKLAKRNGILFESKFKEAKDFLHAKHSKATQVDILPLLRLQDLEALGKKYPQVDMAEIQKQKLNNSKLRRFLNSLKGESYRSTNTIYRPFDFIYSPTMLVYVLILFGLWFTYGITESIEEIKERSEMDVYTHNAMSTLTLMVASILAAVLGVFKIGRRWMIFLAYLVIEVCLLGFAFLSDSEDHDSLVTLNVLYYLCKFSAQFGFIFLLLITAELFPTSLRCQGVGLCFAMKMIGTAIASPDLLGLTSKTLKLCYCLFALFFGSMTLFLPETKTFPLPRSILQIEAMPTPISKVLRSRKVKYAYERRKNQERKYNYAPIDGRNTQVIVASSANDSHISDAGHVPTDPKANNKSSNQKYLTDDSNSSLYQGSYDTINSVHDIEQDDHNKYYNNDKKSVVEQPLLPYENKLGKIVEVPSKNITRNNSTELIELANSKL